MGHSDWLPGPEDGYVQYSAVLKGQTNEIFNLQFFHNLNLPGPLTNGLNKSSFLVKVLRSLKF